MKIEMTATGRTFASRHSLKKSGWGWNGKSWTKTVECPDHIAAHGGKQNDTEATRQFVREHGGAKKGILVTAHNGCTVLFRSKEYSQPECRETPAEARARTSMDRAWHSVSGVPTKADLRDDPDYL